MSKLRTALLSVLAVGALAVGAPAGASVAHSSAPAVHAAAMDTPDGYPDGSANEQFPDIPAQPMCKASGNHYCARIVNNSDTFGTGVFAGNEINGPAENLKFVPDAGSFTFRTHPYTAGHLHFTGHTNTCLQAVNGDGIQTGPCDGNNVVVGHGSSNGHNVWIFRADTQQLNDLRVLGVLDPFGSFFHEVSWFNTDYYKRFDWG